MARLRELLGFVVMSQALCLGCTWHDRHEERLTVDGVPETLALEIGSGDTTVIGDDVSEVRVTAWIEGPSNHLGHGIVGGRLTLFSECNQEPCSVDVTVTVPSEAALEVRSGSGDVQLERLRAPILLRTGSGDVRGNDLSGLDFDAETGSGDMLLDVSQSADRMNVKTGSGDVELSVPSGSYRLTVSQGSGDQEIAGIHDDDSATSAIEIRTGSGDVRVVGR